MCSPTPLLFFGKALVNLDNNESAMDAAAAEHHHAGVIAVALLLQLGHVRGYEMAS
jgi:hypothetical protein